MRLGDVVAEYRKEHKVSMRSFAKQAGVSLAYLSYLEKGINPTTNKPLNPSLDTTIACCKAMDMDIMELFGKLDPELAKEARAAMEEKLEHKTAKNESADPEVTAAPANYPTSVPNGIALTNENLMAAIKERRILLMPTRIPKVGDLVYIPMREYMMATASTVVEAGAGVFRCQAEASGDVLFTIFDLEKKVFTTRGGAAAVVREWEAENSPYAR